MAENPYGSAAILPDGQLNACENCPPETAWGNVWDGVTNQRVLDTLAAEMPVPEKCRGCGMLPECTTFTHCPLKLNRCRETRAVQLTWALRHEVYQLGREGADDGDFDAC